ncbi:serine protease [Phenylobacterium sp. LjRoot219]|uniref:S1 family peptidase n=1 Tax=Phenylobacterium sp. LjRoot219 TaxID=3342283 RepID=UPI003ECF4ABD
MRLPRPPDWLIYAAVVGGLLAAAISRREDVDAPPAPPPVSRAEGQLLAPASPFDPSVTVDVPERSGPSAGTAFSVGSSGVWITARHVIDGCRQAALVVGEGRGVAATAHIDPSGEAALLSTDGGAPALPLELAAPLHEGELAFHPGFPQGEPGEAASRLLGRENLVVRGRGARTEPVLVWAEVGRTRGLEGSLGGLSGAPVLDARGRVLGVTIAESPRRGRIYTTSPETVQHLITQSGTALPVAPTAAAVITPDNYGQVADGLRRDLRVAQVICLS